MASNTAVCAGAIRKSLTALSFTFASWAMASSAATAAPGMTAGPSSMRSGPSVKYAVVMTVPANAMIDVQSCAGAWCRVSWRYRTGYVPADVVSEPAGGQPAYGAPPPVYVEPAPVIVNPYWGPGWGYGYGYRGGWRHGWRR